MIDMRASLAEFIAYAQSLRGDEKGEAQVFCDRLFRAFGHKGYKEAGAILEERVKLADGRTKFADLRWGKLLLLEMKKRGERLGSPRIYNQVYEYWQRLVPNKPQFVVICNFDELWIYEFDEQLDEPMDRVKVTDLPNRWTALNFLLPQPKKPLFGNNRKEVSDATAKKLGKLYQAMVARGETPERAQRFTLQCVVAMFGEDTDLLPRGLFAELVDDCRRGESSYDLLGSLFRQMNTERAARGGRFKNVPHFNGGLFNIIDPIDLSAEEVALLAEATKENWSRIHPGIFGTLFQSTMTKEKRHKRGAHYTPESAIFEYVVRPSLIHSLRARIRETKTLKELLLLRDSLTKIRILDPACGSGNFLYVAYRELKRLELELLEKIHEEFSHEKKLKVGSTASIRTHQFFGIDTDPFAVELAKVTLAMGKKLALDETLHTLETRQLPLSLDPEQALPFDNLDANIRCADALFSEWPKADLILGNPPFQSKNRMQQEFGPDYVQRLRQNYPDVPGRADYCVYWFRRAHDELAPGARAGLVGTNTIRENDSRKGGLDYIVNHGGTITDAVSSMVWPGDAIVHVSVVNWIKGPLDGQKRLSWQEGDSLDSPWHETRLPVIPTSLSREVDVTGAQTLQMNARSGMCFQGQTHGHEGFLLTQDEMMTMIHTSKKNADVIHPYLIGDDLLSKINGTPSRWVIDFFPREQREARPYTLPFQRVKNMVLPDREAAAREEDERNQKLPGLGNNHHANFLKRWWHLSYPRGELMAKLNKLSRYVVCSRVTKRPVFEFVHSRIHPSDALSVFPLEDDYSFGILQSALHWAWFTARCSTLTARFRYTSDTVFDSFPWPQAPTKKQCSAVAKAAVALRTLRQTIAREHGLTLRAMYTSVEEPGEHPLKEAHAALDKAVRAAYGMPARKDALTFLLELNHECARKEELGDVVMGPGLPKDLATNDFVTLDCIEPAPLST